jgi:hypothetical protein
MTASEFAAFVLKNLDCDTWFTTGTLQRRLAGIHGQQLTAARLLAALRNAGWLTAHPNYPDTYCLASVCWLAEKPKAPARTRCEGSQSIAHS